MTRLPAKTPKTIGDSTGHNVKLATSDAYVVSNEEDTATLHPKPQGIDNALRHAVMKQGALGNVVDLLKKPVELFKSKFPYGVKWAERMNENSVDPAANKRER